MNKTENVIQYSDLGEIKYVSNRRARNLAIRINREGDVRVTVPGYVSMKRAEAFVFSKRRWILSKISEREKHLSSAIAVKEGDLLQVRNKFIRIHLKNEKDTLEEAIWRILRKEAVMYLPGRVEELAELNGLIYSGVKVRRMKSRWGSCSAKNGINLNSWLMMLPDHLSDYVILHELVHTRHRDHGPGFWLTLDQITQGQSKMLRRALREEQIMLIHPEQ